MRSTPSLDRGRFVLRRDVIPAAATGALLILAILVLGWLTGGLVTGVWSPSKLTADAAGAAVKPPLLRPCSALTRRDRVQQSAARCAEADRRRLGRRPASEAGPERRAPRRARARRRAAAQGRRHRPSRCLPRPRQRRPPRRRLPSRRRPRPRPKRRTARPRTRADRQSRRRSGTRHRSGR